MVTEVGTSRKPAQMMWASVSLDKHGRAQRSALIILEQDPDALKHGYSSQNYIETWRKVSCLTGAICSCSCRIMRAYTPCRQCANSLKLITSELLTGRHTHQI
jgi:hypothetical protein